MLLAYFLNRAGYYRQTAFFTAVVLTVVTTEASRLYGPINQKQIDALSKTTNSGHLLLQIVNDILYMSKIEDGRNDLRIEENIRVQDD